MDTQKQLLLLGKRCKEIRVKKNLTQAQLAHKINKDRESISRIEQGKVNPSYIYLLELCEGLEITLNELLE